MWTLARFLQNGLCRCGHQSGDDVPQSPPPCSGSTCSWRLTVLSAVPVAVLATMDLSPPQYPCLCTGTAGNRQSQQHPAGKSLACVVQSHGQQELEGARLRALSERFRATRVRAQNTLQSISVPDILHRGLCRRCVSGSFAGRRWRNDWGTGGFLPVAGAIYQCSSYQGLSTPGSRRQPAANILMNYWRQKAIENLGPFGPPVTGALHLDEVTFSYPDSHEPALEQTLP